MIEFKMIIKKRLFFLSFFYLLIVTFSFVHAAQNEANQWVGSKNTRSNGYERFENKKESKDNVRQAPLSLDGYYIFSNPSNDRPLAEGNNQSSSSNLHEQWKQRAEDNQETSQKSNSREADYRGDRSVSKREEAAVEGSRAYSQKENNRRSNRREADYRGDRSVSKREEVAVEDSQGMMQKKYNRSLAEKNNQSASLDLHEQWKQREEAEAEAEVAIEDSQGMIQEEYSKSLAEKNNQSASLDLHEQWKQREEGITGNQELADAESYYINAQGSAVYDYSSNEYSVNTFEREEAQNALIQESLEYEEDDSYQTTEDLGVYKIKIGDRFYISIYGEENTGRSILVDATGSISYLLVGRIFVLGKTIDEVKKIISEKMKKYYNYTVITMTPLEFGGEYYTILGEIKSPGRKPIRGKITLLMALAQSKGFTEGTFRTQTIEIADLSHAFLARDGDFIEVDFNKLVQEGDTSQDVVLRHGDYIYIPNSLYQEIYIFGEVNAPTTIGYLNTITLAEAITQARGVTNDASSRIIVIRGSLANPTRFDIDLKRILLGEVPDFLLQPGDLVYAPEYRFKDLKDIVKLGIKTFVSSFMGIGGGKFFQDVHPHADGTDVTPALVVP